ncbi:MAG TPA: undecaprenyl-diphosphate phosphatase [Streptosporangiaceae bacterium]|nr:undecaprenyl-diphosphate phosphatase [Streptosporangiaceae bacterium]
MSHITYLEAAVVGLIQGVTELFPVSSLGHNVLIPALIGGSWASDLNVAQASSPYLAFIVGMHVATALALLVYFWRDWVRIIGGFFSSVRHRQVRTRDQKLAWMIIVATIPVGLVGVVADKPFREIFGKPIVAGVFLIINGVILYCGEKFRPRASVRADQIVAAERERELVPAGPGWPGPATSRGPDPVRHARHRQVSGHQAVRQEELAQAVAADERLVRIGYLKAVTIGAAQILALLAGISRDGVTMVAGMGRGLSREDAARFAFLLATPVILAAGVLELPKLTGPLGNGIHGQILLGSVLSFVGAYVSVRFLMKYFQTRTLTPFALYCFVFGLLSVAYLGVIK